MRRRGRANPWGREPFADRAEAGAALALLLTAYRNRPDVLVLALPRGGVPVAAPVSAALHAPLDVVIVRKLGLLRQPELAMGALAGVAGHVQLVLHEPVLRAARVPPEEFVAVRDAELAELYRREQAYRQGRPALAVAGRTVLVVDDGAATGSTVRAAVAALRPCGPARVVIALPVCPTDTRRALEGIADEVICAREPAYFDGVGQEYRDFSAPSDDEVRALLRGTAA